MKKEFVGYIAFYNKNGLHYKVKVIFFVISQIKIHWFNVSISVFTFLYQNKNEADRWKSAHLFGVERGRRVSDNNTYSLIVDHSSG